MLKRTMIKDTDKTVHVYNAYAGRVTIHSSFPVKDYAGTVEEMIREAHEQFKGHAKEIRASGET